MTEQSKEYYEEVLDDISNIASDIKNILLVTLVLLFLIVVGLGGLILVLYQAGPL